MIPLRLAQRVEQRVWCGGPKKSDSVVPRGTGLGGPKNQFAYPIFRRAKTTGAMPR